MRSRRSLHVLHVLLVSAAVLSACGGSANKADQTTAAPTTTVGPAPATSVGAAPLLTTAAPDLASTTPAPTTTVATTAATSPAPPTTLAPTTVATTLIPTTTRQAVTLPPGVTEADRIAAEAAAIGWWEEYYRQVLALPDFDPKAILALTVPGRPAGPAMVSLLEEDRRDRFTFRPGTLVQRVLLDTRFLSSNSVEIQVCLSDDGVFVQEGSGVEKFGGLGRSFYLTVLRRSPDGWKVEDWGSFQDSERGRTCA